MKKRNKDLLAVAVVFIFFLAQAQGKGFKFAMQTMIHVFDIKQTS